MIFSFCLLFLTSSLLHAGLYMGLSKGFSQTDYTVEVVAQDYNDYSNVYHAEGFRTTKFSSNRLVLGYGHTDSFSVEFEVGNFDDRDEISGYLMALNFKYGINPLGDEHFFPYLLLGLRTEVRPYRWDNQPFTFEHWDTYELDEVKSGIPLQIGFGASYVLANQVEIDFGLRYLMQGVTETGVSYQGYHNYEYYPYKEQVKDATSIEFHIGIYYHFFGASYQGIQNQLAFIPETESNLDIPATSSEDEYSY